ncbi:MAG: GC-type dockerin domain-anchored protein [Phycisphaerales bacterium JB060]
MLTVFDSLEFLRAFDAGEAIADFDNDGQLTIADFLAFQNAFAVGCP